MQFFKNIIRYLISEIEKNNYFIIQLLLYTYIFLQNFGYITLFNQVCITFIPLFRWTHFSVSFKINFKLYTLDKKNIIKQ